MNNNCENKIQNTGASACRSQFGIVVKALFFANKNMYLTGNDEADILEDLQDKIQSSSKTNRCFPFALFKGMEDKSEDLKTATYGYGETSILGDGKPAYDFQYVQDIEATKKYRSFNKQEGRVMFITEDGKLICEKKDNKFYGFVGTPYFEQGRFPNGADLMVSTLHLSLADAAAFQDRVAVIDLGVSPNEINGLVDVDIEEVGTGHTEFKIRDNMTGDDITANYAALLNHKEAWLINGAQPAADPSYNSTGNKFTFGTPATGSVTLVNPALLAELTNPVLGIEASVLTIA